MKPKRGRYTPPAKDRWLPGTRPYVLAYRQGLIPTQAMVDAEIEVLSRPERAEYLREIARSRARGRDDD